MTGRGVRGGGVVHGHHVEGALKRIMSQVWVLFRRPRRAAREVVGGGLPRGNRSVGEVERVRLGDLHKVHKVPLVKGWRGKEVGVVEDIFAARGVGVNHGSRDARVDLQEW